MFSPIESQEQILKLRDKIEKTQDQSKYTKDEMALIEVAYHEITNTYAPKNCSSCTILFKILRNYFKKYDQRIIAPVFGVDSNHTPEELNKAKDKLVEDLIKSHPIMVSSRGATVMPLTKANPDMYKDHSPKLVEFDHSELPPEEAVKELIREDKEREVVVIDVNPVFSSGDNISHLSNTTRTRDIKDLNYKELKALARTMPNLKIPKNVKKADLIQIIKDDQNAND